jgi:PAS domain S-box-containing protein
MLVWLFEEAGKFADVITLIGVIAAGGAGVVRMLLASKKRVEALFEAVERIETQFKPNGGSSIFDILKQTQAQTAATAVKVSQLGEALGKVKAWQWTFAETLPTPMWESDERGQCIRINSALSKLVNRSLEDMTGAGWENIIDKPDRQRVWVEWQDAIAKSRTFELSYVVTSRGGLKYNVDASATPITNEAGRVVSYIGRYTKVEPVNANHSANG